MVKADSDSDLCKIMVGHFNALEDNYVLRNPSPPDSPDKFCPLTEEQIVKEKGRTLLKDTDIELSISRILMSR